jgi:FKBP-type peptidyl-prolyl cis-trans isomerase
MKRSLLCLLALTGALTACESDPTGPTCELTALPLASVTGDTVTTRTGLRYLQVQAGTGGTADVGERAGVRFAGSLTNGTVFDEGAFQFGLGLRQVIPGFEEGVLGMRVCETRRLIVPAGLAYGNDPPAGSGIPAGATLIFDVQLVQLD